MPSITFWPAIGGGTKHYRCLTPGAALERLGWDVSYKAEDDWASADVIVLQRVIVPWALEIIRKVRAKRPHTVFVFDIDDWYDGIPAYNKASKEITPEVIDLMHRLMAEVDLITVSTPALAEGYAPYNRTAVLPNYLDPDIFADVEKYRGSHEGIWVGWLNAWHWREADAELLKPWLPHFLDEHPEVSFVSCGGPEVIEYLGVKGFSTPIVPETGSYLRPYDHLPAMLAPLDIGLCPVVDNRFNRCKSWCKALEYNACGVPAVASPSPEYRSYITPGENGYLVRKNAWASTLQRALDNLDELKHGARWVASQHVIDGHIHKWVDAYAEVSSVPVRHARSA